MFTRQRTCDGGVTKQGPTGVLGGGYISYERGNPLLSVVIAPSAPPLAPSKPRTAPQAPPCRPHAGRRGPCCRARRRPASFDHQFDHGKVVWDFACRPRPESGRDWLSCMCQCPTVSPPPSSTHTPPLLSSTPPAPVGACDAFTRAPPLDAPPALRPFPGAWNPRARVTC